MQAAFGSSDSDAEEYRADPGGNGTLDDWKAGSQPDQHAQDEDVADPQANPTGLGAEGMQPQPGEEAYKGDPGVEQPIGPTGANKSALASSRTQMPVVSQVS